MKWTNLIKDKSKLLMVFLFTVCVMQSNAQKGKTNSLLWEISGNGLQQSSYLFGTIHMICKEDFLLSETVKQKIQFQSTNLS